MKRNLLLLILLSIALYRCNQPTQKVVRSADEEQIRNARYAHNLAIEKRDTATLASYWTPDFHVVTSRNLERPGKATNLSFFVAEFTAKPDVLYVRNPDIVEVFSDWNMAAESGHWVGTWTEGGSRVELAGSYFAKWHKVNGRWMIRAEIFVPLSCKGGELCGKSPI